MSIPKVSDKALALIEEFEIGSEQNYISRPVWPGGESGITIGIGYDIGTKSPPEVFADWKDRLPQTDLNRLVQFCGMRGPSVERFAIALTDLEVPYNAAKDVFVANSIPRYTAMTLTLFPNAAALPADCLGALVSLVYNRGTSLAQNERRHEMLLIFEDLQNGDIATIPSSLRKMKRLWPDLKGLQDRREREALLYEEGLATLPPEMLESSADRIDREIEQRLAQEGPNTDV